MVVTVYVPRRNILFVQSLVANQWFLTLPYYLLHHIKCQLAKLFRGILTFSFETLPPAGREQCLVEAFSASHIFGSTLYLKSRSPIWRLMSVISLLGKLRQEDSCEFEASLGNIARPYLKVKQMDKKRNLVMGNRLSTSDIPYQLGKPGLEGRASDSCCTPPICHHTRSWGSEKSFHCDQQVLLRGVLCPVGRN